MNQSEQVNELFAALSKAQGQMQHAIKDSTNPHFKSSYANLAAVIDASREPLSANGLTILQTMDQVNGRDCIITILGHTSGQWMKSVMPIVTTKQDAQGYGSGITYMRRYCLAAIIGISQDDDDGNKAVEKREEFEEETLKAARDLYDLLKTKETDEQSAFWKRLSDQGRGKFLIGFGKKELKKFMKDVEGFKDRAVSNEV